MMFAIQCSLVRASVENYIFRKEANFDRSVKIALTLTSSEHSAAVSILTDQLRFMTARRSFHD